eukprot:m.196623 g.196623  ORF g.196623 m.196623 type:complete len:135 (-) comp15256_c0_seq2:1867-2271(-)
MAARLLTMQTPRVAVTLRPGHALAHRVRWLQQGGGVYQAKRPVSDAVEAAQAGNLVGPKVATAAKMAYKGAIGVGGLLAGAVAFFQLRDRFADDEDQARSAPAPGSPPTNPVCIISYCTKTDPSKKKDRSGQRM